MNKNVGRKKTIGIGLVVAILMITSAFTFGTTADDPEIVGLEVVKEVWDVLNNEWTTDKAESWIDCEALFRITITYNAPCMCPECYHVNNTVITDYLPACLEYNGTSSIVPYYPYLEFNEEDNILTWDFGDKKLFDGDFIEIVFTATVIDYGLNVNTVQVAAEEWYDHIMEPLSGEDSAAVFVYGVEMDKKVWDETSDEWSDSIDWVILDQTLRFKITITYHGEDIMKCMLVEDYLPDCILDYIGNEEFFYPDNNIFSDPEIIITEQSEPIPDVKWDWTNSLFNLYSGQSIVIEFDAVVSNYTGTLITNLVKAYLWGCPDCPALSNEAECHIFCGPHPTTFEKKVLDGDVWSEETSAIVGENVRFKLEINYYEDLPNHLHTIEIEDHLPTCLEYVAGSATIEPSDVSGDNKTIIWDFPEEFVITYTEPLTLEFEAKAIENSGCCGVENFAIARFIESCYGGYFVFSDTANISIEENSPPTYPIIEGDTSGEVGESLTFRIKADDLNGDQVYYNFDWGEGILTSIWLGPYNEGDWIEGITHSWSSEGTYTVRARAKDVHDAESDWSNSITVEITAGEEPPEPEPGDNISIIDVKGGIRTITATIKNTGDEDMKPVNWSIKVEGTLLTRKNVETNGTVEIDADGEEDVEGDGSASMLAFGRITVTVTAESEGYGSDTVVRNGFVIGPFIRIRPE